MSKPKAQQTTKNKKTISVMTIRFSVTIETTEESKRYFSRHIKLSRNRVDRLKVENVCRDRENYVGQDPKAGRHKKLAANRFCVATQSNHVAIKL